MSTPNTYTLDGGDDMDNVTKISKGNVYEQTISPYAQYHKTVDFWKPVQEAGKLLCMLDDNHSFRSRELADWHCMEMICGEIGARYGGFGAFLDLYVGPQRYTIYTLHGTRSATTDAGALNQVIRMNQRCMADIYLRFHHHRKIIHQDEIKKMTDKGLVEHKRTYCINGSFLEWDNSYAERMELNISIKGSIKIRLFVKEWEVRPSL